MKVINATVSFEIKTKLRKDNLEYIIIDYTSEIEDLLDYDCDVSEPKKIDEDNYSVTLLFPVDAYLEIVDEKDTLKNKEDEQKEVESGALHLQSLLDEGLLGDITLVNTSYSSKTFEDIYAYKNWVLQDSILMLLSKDMEFESSFKDLIFGDEDKEITGAHISGDGLYFQGIDEEGDHFILALKYVKERNQKDFEKLEKHTSEIFPSGSQFIVEITEEGKSDDEWSLSSEDDEIDTYNMAINLEDVELDIDGFYAADSLLCCIDEDYESRLDDYDDEGEYYDDDIE